MKRKDIKTSVVGAFKEMIHGKNAPENVQIFSVMENMWEEYARVVLTKNKKNEKLVIDGNFRMYGFLDRQDLTISMEDDTIVLIPKQKYLYKGKFKPLGFKHSKYAEYILTLNDILERCWIILDYELSHELDAVLSESCMYITNNAQSAIDHLIEKKSLLKIMKT